MLPKNYQHAINPYTCKRHECWNVKRCVKQDMLNNRTTKYVVNCLALNYYKTTKKTWEKKLFLTKQRQLLLWQKKYFLFSFLNFLACFYLILPEFYQILPVFFCIYGYNFFLYSFLFLHASRVSSSWHFSCLCEDI